jgi:ATP-dependent helicase HrpB
MVSVSLPVLEIMPQVRAALEAHDRGILIAPPGAGKSTGVPLALLNEAWLAGQKIVMLQPRRLAARAVASRMAGLLNETVGRTVGYAVRLERRVSEHTRIEVVTEGILTRRLQSDPGLDGVGLVIFDEFHERSLHADTALALTLEVQGALRDDLRVLVMSATLDAAALSRTLGDAPVVSSSGRSYPVEVRYAPRDADDVLRAVANTVRNALDAHDGDALVFLPGAMEIQRVQSALGDVNAAIHPLYGDLPLEAQQAAILPGSERRVVLSTNIAETSLTIEGVRIVVDSGLTRVSRFEPGLGLSRLETTRITGDSADQRAGRAGRVAPGVCYRVWTPATQAGLLPARVPEILEADLAPLALELAAWGASENDLTWVTKPPAGAMAQGRALLRSLGALEADDRITAHGRAMHDLGTHPRLAHLLLEGQRLGLSGLAADLAALLEERDPLPREVGADATLRLEALRHDQSSALKRVRQLSSAYRSRLEGMRVTTKAQPSEPRRASSDAYTVGKLIALAYPERVAQRREGSFERFKLSGGRGVKLLPSDPLSVESYLAVAHVDAGTDEGRVFLAAPLDPRDLNTQTRETVAWDAKNNVLIARREVYFGDLTVEHERLERIPDDARVAALCDAVRLEGLGVLDWTPTARQWQARVQSLRVWRTDSDLPESSDAALLDTLEDWLAPHLSNVRKREDFARINLLEALQNRFTWAQTQHLETLAPTKLDVPSGSRITLEYDADGSPPVFAVRLQEVFGWLETPFVNDGRTPVLMHLLSPAYRPVQVTQDLRSFWQNTYPVVRKELKIRYPKHSWPENPWTAEAVRGVKRKT